MCHIYYGPDHEEADFRDLTEPGRPLPRLTWGLPLNVAELGASLEAFEELQPRIQALRLCHRFREGLISTMPQEILDMIVKALYRATRGKKLQRWVAQFMCFQGRCSRSQHINLDDKAVEDLWHTFFRSTADCCARHRCEADLNYDDNNIEERRRMVKHYIEEDSDIMDESVWEAHEYGRDRWLDMVCLCKETGQSITTKTFMRLHRILKSSFGLEATILHEEFSERLRSFLPDSFNKTLPSYYTSCFLTLAGSSVTSAVARSRTESHANPAFLNQNNNLAYHQKIDLASLQISEKQRSLFSRALMILDLQPAFHVTDLETSLVFTANDPALSKISDMQLTGGPTIPPSSLHERKSRLEQYLKGKDEEVRKQEWPQLMVMAASNAVCPSS